MDLDKIRVNVRPRTTAQAIDLGFVMARHWWRPLMLSWLMLALPMFILFHLIFYQMPWIAGLLVWLCKPLYEQAPLHVLSRALFSEKTSMKEIAKNLRSIAGKQMIANLTWRRLSLRRSFNAPVSQLEGLKGDARKKRINVLHGNKPSGGWLTFICVHLELVFYLSIFALISLFIPREIEVNAFELITGETFWIILLQDFIYLLAIAIVAPFYIAAGFSLYLHRRIELEAWDIELDFRKLNTRLNSQKRSSTNLAALFVVCSLLTVQLTDSTAMASENFLTTSDQTSPAPTKETAQQQIQEILKDEVFGQEETHKVWREIESDDQPEDIGDFDLDWLQKIAEAIAFIGEFILWVIIGALVLWIVYLYPKWTQWFGIKSITPRKKYRAPETLFGLDVRPESLPDDIGAEAWRLCQDNQMRAALSLLYRASLVTLMNQHKLEFHKGATEGECLKIVQQTQLQELGNYFYRLTVIWKAMAYGHQAPSLDDMQSLCEHWREHLGTKHEPAC